MFNIFKDTEEELDTVVSAPIDKKAMEDLIKLVDVAYETGCHFDLKLDLTIGTFCIDSLEYTGMKLLPKNKKEPDRVTISYSSALLSNDTVINLENIINVTLNLKYCGKGDVNEETK